MENSQLESYFKELTPRQKEQFVSFEKLFLEVNQRINLISRKDHNNFFIHHLLHSLSIANFFKFKSGTDVLDLGTGGGLPGIPLAIMFPEVNFLLCDSIRKKLTAVDEMVEYLQLKNVSTAWQRAETIERRFDFVVSRAVAPLEQLLFWTYKKYKKLNSNEKTNGLICLKGGDLHQEISDAHNYLKASKIPQNITLKDISEWYKEEFFETKKLVYCAL